MNWSRCCGRSGSRPMKLKTPDAWEQVGPLNWLLLPLAWLYRRVSLLRGYFSRPVEASVPLICVGNVTAGGAGKTPVALALGELIKERGFKLHFLSKGYGGSLPGPVRVNPSLQGSELVGDEPLLLSRVATTWVAEDRAVGADVAVSSGAEILVMDDGLQNPTIRRDFSLLVVDGGYGFGNGMLIPAGPLREPVEESFAKADAIVLVGQDEKHVEGFFPKDKPVIHATLEPNSVRADALEGKRVVAFAGIARPEKFFDTLKEIGCDVVETVSFPDHYPFRATDMEMLNTRAQQQSAILVTTEKDAVRIPEFYRKRVEVLPIQIKWVEKEQLLNLLKPVFDNASAALSG